MNTIYETAIENKYIINYIEHLINKVFALLPMYEEVVASDNKKDSFYTYQKTLIQRINGHADMIMDYNSILVVDILSHLQSLLLVSNHSDYRRHVMRICKLLTMLRDEVKTYGL